MRAGFAGRAAAAVAVGVLVWGEASSALAFTDLDQSGTPTAEPPAADAPVGRDAQPAGSWGGDVVPLAALGLGLVVLGSVLNGAHRQQADD
ncbi:hypothetical protein GA0070609_5282 [Micromonospora echinaurantiaca]|uniref:MYXO-CTERM domain-containing protein n=1 Tax=Micromonospora echinaurantiaca TaxID=47857 RepID=A0A1C5K1T1_9ACTN|nr:hypothetical protein [Micromonospora echinaurantiaca]SCG76755.1 hypothetical protein GA0070609_5282 [Micromonospora echinaurantiaca]